MGGKGSTRTVARKDIGLEEGNRVFETGDFLHRVDPAGIAAFRG